MVAPQPADFDPQLSEFIKRKIRRLTGRHGLTTEDIEDLEQDLYLHVSPGMATHDPAKSPRGAFTTLLIKRELAHWMDARTARKRDWRRQRQLSDDHDVADRDNIQRKILRIDMRDAIAALPVELQRWAWWFADHDEAEVIRLSGQSRGKVRAMWQRVVAAIRKMHRDEDF